MILMVTFTVLHPMDMGISRALTAMAISTIHIRIILEILQPTILMEIITTPILTATETLQVLIPRGTSITHIQMILVIQQAMTVAGITILLTLTISGILLSISINNDLQNYEKGQLLDIYVGDTFSIIMWKQSAK